MNSAVSNHRGFSLVELVAILVIVGVLAVTAASKFGQAASQEVMTRRDDLIAAVSLAQQLSMVRTNDVRLSVNGSQIDVQENSGSFTSVRMGNVQYPLDISPVVVNGGPYIIEFDRLGRVVSPAAPLNLVVQRGTASKTVTISPSGFSQ